jgi:hypothetical protein
MDCTLCLRDRTQYDPACLTCGGRYLRDIQRLRVPEVDKRKRLRKALTDWMAHGHAEDRLRELAARRPK